MGAIDSFKARLKNRFQKFKQKQNQLKQQGSSNFGRGSVTQVDASSILKTRSGSGRNLSGRRSRKQRPRSRSRDSRERKIDVIEEIEEETTIQPQRTSKSKSS